MDLPVAPTAMIDLLRAWFFAKDRSIVLAANTCLVSDTFLCFQTDIPHTEKLRITAAGNVGIGESSPGAMLQIQTSGTGIIGQIIKATASQTADLVNVNDSLGNRLVRILSNGRTFIDVGTAFTVPLSIFADQAASIAVLNIENTGAFATNNEAGFDLKLATSTQARTAFRFAVRLTDTTDATRTARVDLQVLDSGSLAARMSIKGSNVGVGTQNPAAKLHVDQKSTTGAIPVAYFDQADVSEEMFEFASTVGVGNAIEAVGAKTLTVTHFIKHTITGVGNRY